MSYEFYINYWKPILRSVKFFIGISCLKILFILLKSTSGNLTQIDFLFNFSTYY